MIPLIPLGGFGITRGIYQMIGLIEEHSSELLSVAKINDGDDTYSFIALFREKNSIGGFVAFINEWGTNDGKSGTGGGGYQDMIQYLEDHNIQILDYDLTHYPEYLQFNELKRNQSCRMRMDLWQEIVLDMCLSIELPTIYPSSLTKKHKAKNK
jgi:hypothetical protein